MASAERDAALPIRILMLEDSALDAELIVAQLTRSGLAFTHDRVWQRDAFIAAVARVSTMSSWPTMCCLALTATLRWCWRMTWRRRSLSSSSPGR